jgi:hypothetical protein
MENRASGLGSMVWGAGARGGGGGGKGVRGRGRGVGGTGASQLKEFTSPQDPTGGLCLWSWGGPRKVDVFLWARYPCRGKGVGGRVEGWG